MKRRTRVYVAGPMLTSGNPYLNVRDGIRAGTTLMARGYVPFIPHLTALWEMAAHEIFTYEDWLSIDFAAISVSDAMLRLPGPSKGADREVAYATSLVIPVYHSLDTLLAGIGPERDDVLHEVAAERRRQDRKWGDQTHRLDGTRDDEHSRYVRDIFKNIRDKREAEGGARWIDILNEEVAEALAEEDPAKLRAELVQVAAVAAGWIEAIDKRLR